MSSRNEYLPSDTHLLSSGTIPPQKEYTQILERSEGGRNHTNKRDWTEEEPEALPPLRPNRKKGDDLELGSQRLTEFNLSKHNIRVRSNVNPMVSNYTSPIGQFFLFFFCATFFFETGIWQISHPIRTLTTEDN
jgi:hypothetical protein